jgi:uncharacterized membrane protein YczE
MSAATSLPSAPQPTSRGWSAASAVIEVLMTGSTRRVLAFTSRVAILIAGAFTIGLSVAVMLWNNLGAGPLDVFIGALRAHTGLPLAVAVWLTVGTLISIAWLLGRRPGPGTVLAPFIVAPIMQTALAALRTIEPADVLAIRIVIHMLAIGALGVGAGAVVTSGLGAGTGELLTSATAARVGHKELHVRACLELTWVTIGVLLGGPAGVGTILVAFLIGPSVARGRRIVNAATSRARKQVATTRQYALDAAA